LGSDVSQKAVASRLMTIETAINPFNIWRTRIRTIPPAPKKTMKQKTRSG
jgi:hypothetical protein